MNVKKCSFQDERAFKSLYYSRLLALWSMLIKTASGNFASMREPLDGSLWWYWIAANAAKKNGASFKNYERLNTGIAPTCNWRIKIVIK